jgi:hypothetical protein
MLGHTGFRWLLASIGAAVAAVFGAVGLWERNHLLSQPSFFNGSTWWDSTARFHLWPWPYKLAAICNMPAFIGGWITMLPIRLVWPTLSEAGDLAPSVILAALLWYWVGSRLETYSASTRWTWLFSFGGASLTGAFIQMGYTGWLIYGVVMWSIAVLFLQRSWARFKKIPRQLA